jgi:hypothetical protein
MEFGFDRVGIQELFKLDCGKKKELAPQKRWLFRM